MTEAQLNRFVQHVRYNNWTHVLKHEQDVLELGSKAARHIHYENRSRGRFIVGLNRVGA